MRSRTLTSLNDFDNIPIGYKLSFAFKELLSRQADEKFQNLLDSNDIALLEKSQRRGNYTRNAYLSLKTLCSSLDFTEREHIDVAFVAQVIEQATKQELSDRELFFTEIFESLSTTAKDAVTDLMETLRGTSRMTIREPDFLAAAQAAPSQFIDTLAHTCNSLDELYERQTDPTNKGAAAPITIKN